MRQVFVKKEKKVKIETEVRTPSKETLAIEE